MVNSVTMQISFQIGIFFPLDIYIYIYTYIYIYIYTYIYTHTHTHPGVELLDQMAVLFLLF